MKLLLSILPLLIALSLKAQTVDNSRADTTIYKKADLTVKAEFPGGEKKYSNFLIKTIRYPAVARENNIQGMVRVTFVVEQDGTLTDVKVSESAGKILDDEALRIIRLSPKWIPGKIGDKIVRCLMDEPFAFRLSSK